MKRSKLSTALALATAIGGLIGGAYAPSASAVSISAQNLGDVLIFPYYTVRNGWNTLFNMTNTSPDTLAVKIRFLEGHNSREVLDFTVVLSPNDVFAGYVTENSKGDPVFLPATGETSCTAPFIPTGGLALSNFGYSAGNSDHSAQNDGWYPVPGDPPGYLRGGLSTIDRAKEGYVIAIVEGHAPAGREDQPDNTGGFSRVAYNAKHVGGAPRNCDTVRTAFTRNQIILTANEFGEPTNALKGNYSYLNAARGIADGGNAVTLANFVQIGPDENHFVDGVWGRQGPIGPAGCVVNPTNPPTTNMFFNPATQSRNPAWAPVFNTTTYCPNLIAAQEPYDSYEPTLADAYPNQALTLNDNVLPDVAATVTNFGPYGYGFWAVSEVLRARSVINEWSFNPALGATTEWIVTHPTKNFFVDAGTSSAGTTLNDTSANNPHRFPGGFSPDANIRLLQIPIPPFSEAFSGVTDGQSCNDVGVTAYDRDETRLLINRGGVIESPLPRFGTLLCFEANVIEFSNSSGSIFGSRLTLNLDPEFAALPQPYGWMELDLAKPLVAHAGAFVTRPVPTGGLTNQLPGDGLPAVGFMIKQRVLGTDKLNYGSMADHSYRGRGVPCSSNSQDPTDRKSVV